MAKQLGEKITGTLYRTKQSKPVFVFDDFMERKVIAARIEELNADELAEAVQNIIEDIKVENNREDFSGSSNEDR